MILPPPLTNDGRNSMVKIQGLQVSPLAGRGLGAVVRDLACCCSVEASVTILNLKLYSVFVKSRESDCSHSLYDSKCQLV